MSTQQRIPPFQFKHFSVWQDRCAMKVGTDGVLLGAWADVTGATRLLDVGTGSGLIALMLAQRQQAGVVDAVEVDEAAAGQAHENVTQSPWAGRIKVIHQSIQEYAQQVGVEGGYDLVVSNPPFFTGGVLSENQSRQEVRHTVKLPHGELLAAVRKLLRPAGKFCLVLPLIEGLRFQEMARSYGLYTTRVTEVSARPQKQVHRLLLQLEKNAPSQPVQPGFLTVYEAEGDNWSEAYRQLTRDFYLKI